MKFSDENQMTIRDLSFNSDEEITKLDENINKLKVCSTRHSSNEAKSPTSTKGSGKCGRPANPVPRHKRDSHIKAEHKRRDKIQKGFDTFRELVPALENCSAKESKSSMLFKTAEHCRQLKVESKAQQDEALALRHEIESLGNQIHLLQGKLPAVGIKVLENSNSDMDVLYKKYIKQKSKESWKFWMFSFLIDPLFETYKKATEEVTGEVFVEAVGKWVEENMSLVNLRPAILTALRKVSTKTKIVNKPQEFKTEVMELISHLGDENGNDSTKTDTEVVNTNTTLKPDLIPHVNTTLTYNQHISSPSLLSHDHQPMKTFPIVQQMNEGSNLHHIPNTHQTPVVHSIHTKSESALKGHVTNTCDSQITHSGSHDVPMTCGEIWDVPASLPATDSSSSLSEIVFTSAEESTLYDSILNSFSTSDSMNNMFTAPLGTMSDMSHDLFPTCVTASSFPVMTTHHDHHPLDFGSFTIPSDQEMVASHMESNFVTFTLDTDQTTSFSSL